ncbi:hypothetical protein ACKKBG_A38595 [Auxenochlorella protothecoides x Auxenochlorella symbiontica]
MRTSALALLALLAFAALLAPVRATEDVDEVDDEDSSDFADRAFLIVRRVVADKRPIQGKTTTVTVELYNAGSTSALEVKAVESKWPEPFFSVSGDLSASYESIPAGATVRFTYQVTAQEAGPYQHPPTQVSYQAVEDDEDSVKSTSSAYLYFVTSTLVDEWKFKALELGSKLTGGNINTVSGWKWSVFAVAAALIAYYGHQSYLSVQDASKTKRRQRALEELQAMDSKSK